jgi:hypothetical protein
MIFFAAALLLAVATTAAAAQSAEPAPSPDELRRLIEHMIANTHHNDAAIENYERVEHWVARRTEIDPQVRLDKTYRVVPTGTGTLRVVLKENGSPVSPEYYRGELQTLAQVLEWALDPDEPKQKARVTKWEKRTAERYEAVEAFRDAYTVEWLGHETREGRALVKLRFDPKPDFHGHSMGTDLLSSSRVTVWLGPGEQVVRLEAELVRDMAFGGGLLGKLYRGGRVTIDQMEIAPGLWMPRSTRYDVRGRKFIFSSEEWRSGDASDYRRVGPPREALQIVREELSRLPHGAVPGHDGAAAPPLS